MNRRTLPLIVVFTLASLPAFAQGRPPAAGETLKSLSEQVAALAARVAKLESGRVTAQDLAGTYRWAYLGVQLQGNPARIDLESIDSEATTLTLNSDGTLLISVSQMNCRLQQGAPWAVIVPCDSEGGEGTGNWRLENGRLLIEFPDGDTLDVAVTAGGRVLVHSGAVSSEAFGYAFANIGLFVKLAPQ
jgi:hypothetical protein